ncbi:glycosyltransferase [Adlercreutzia sp. ZJ242]|uniref:glycosyltransferase n=1 Tax=Adlercreutzia sp. ZJ242 TaxID=2709409 RepID=UPI00210232DB|nr:glycosyltransferase [Adlercreutzia sp. ZJ242]
MELSSTDICAVIISFNCDDMEKTVESLISQCGCILIVDNGSKDDYLAHIRRVASSYNVGLIELGENLGQAAALNIGCEAAERAGFPLMLTMDQDSVLCDGCVQELLAGIEKGYASVGPNYCGKALRKRFTDVRYLITSGNLVKVEAMRGAGGFTEELFIDSVDFDFSLKLRKQGYNLAMAKNAMMVHSIGDRTEGLPGHTILGHSVERHYYIARNQRYILYRYFAFDPVFCIKLWISGLRSEIELREENNIAEKREARVRGRRDAADLLLAIARREDDETSTLLYSKTDVKGL